MGDSPVALEYDSFRDRIYVANSGSDTISVISTKNDTKIKDTAVGENPIFVYREGVTIYVANSGSDSLSLIDGRATKLVAGITIEINHLNSGYIEGDELLPPTGQYFYLYSGTECIAKPNKGFEFLSWEENITNNSTQILKVSTSTSELESIKNFFGIKSEAPEAKLKMTKFGSFTANFKELSPPLLPEYWATLFGVVVTAFISSWLTPTIIGWRKTKKHVDTLNKLQKDIRKSYHNYKIDKNDISNLNTLREKIISAYTRGDLTKDQYDVLLHNITIRYNEIFHNEITSLKNTSNEKEKIKL